MDAPREGQNADVAAGKGETAGIDVKTLPGNSGASAHEGGKD